MPRRWSGACPTWISYGRIITRTTAPALAQLSCAHPALSPLGRNCSMQVWLWCTHSSRKRIRPGVAIATTKIDSAAAMAIPPKKSCHDNEDGHVYDLWAESGTTRRHRKWQQDYH